MRIMGSRGVIRRPVKVSKELSVESKDIITDLAGSNHYSYATNNLIFLMVSDVGAEEMTTLLLQHGQRSAVPLTALRSRVKTVLDAQWGRLHFERAVNAIVPFLPLEPTHVEEVG